MATQTIGRVSIIAKGEYDNDEQYFRLDVVSYEGNGYIAKKDTVGNLPTDTTYWALVCSKGGNGDEGPEGPAGETGNGIASISKTSTAGIVDTYTITMTDGTTSTFTVTNGTATTWDELNNKPFTALSNEFIVEGDELKLAADIVVDADYVHTDNNYSNIEKAKVAGKAENTQTTITQASTRTNLASGDTIPQICGKIKKWFSDLGTLAFKSKVASGDLETELGNTISNHGTQIDNIEGNPSEWSSGSYYMAGSYVIYNMKLYCAKINVTSSDVPGTSANWEEVSMTSLKNTLVQLNSNLTNKIKVVSYGHVFTLSAAGTSSYVIDASAEWTSGYNLLAITTSMPDTAWISSVMNVDANTKKITIGARNFYNGQTSVNCAIRLALHHS